MEIYQIQMASGELGLYDELWINLEDLNTLSTYTSLSHQNDGVHGDEVDVGQYGTTGCF